MTNDIIQLINLAIAIGFIYGLYVLVKNSIKSTKYLESIEKVLIEIAEKTKK